MNWEPCSRYIVGCSFSGDDAERDVEGMSRLCKQERLPGGVLVGQGASLRIVFYVGWQHLPFILADLLAADVDCQPEEAVRALLGDRCTPLAIELTKDAPPGIFYDYLAELLG